MFQNLLKLLVPLSKYNILKIKVIFWYFKRKYVCNIDPLKLNVKDHYHTFFNNLTAYFHGDRLMLQILFFFSKRRLYVLFHPLVIIHILNRFFKIFNILKLKDIFNYRLLTFYYKRHTCNKVPHYIATFLPNTSIAINRYPVRHARLQPPL